jgi:hypothetical protein
MSTFSTPVNVVICSVTEDAQCPQLMPRTV